ncbi:carbonic anhydrase [Marinobacterium nitratireducens]|uniref:Carbonic anhydrase n=1 Tax=Marinobacterium nitratireducens TaxID=518897 RepID=A0A917Z936_9GAMM|nr:carbonate dehydratase [Marinobacterium nitratireducens]GGO78353.1 carbonic anhydrase [Marinobacterium nitratireducens]
MKKLQKLFEQNQAWSERISRLNPEFFPTLAKQQAPEYLWIGCSDSRVPANEIIGLLPGDVFVHRNVSNLVTHTDMNCLSVLQYAVRVLKVKHVMVVGHYGCGGVKASLGPTHLGLIDNWLRHVKDVYIEHREMLSQWEDNEEFMLDRLCELNVIEQAVNVCNTTMVQEAWSSGQELAIHGWIYGLDNGKLRDLNFCVCSADEIDEQYRLAVETIAAKQP